MNSVIRRIRIRVRISNPAVIRYIYMEIRDSWLANHESPSIHVIRLTLVTSSSTFRFKDWK